MGRSYESNKNKDENVTSNTPSVFRCIQEVSDICTLLPVCTHIVQCKEKCVSVYGVLHFILRQFLGVSADLNTVGVLPFCHAALHQIIVV